MRGGFTFFITQKQQRLKTTEMFEPHLCGIYLHDVCTLHVVTMPNYSKYFLMHQSSTLTSK